MDKNLKPIVILAGVILAAWLVMVLLIYLFAAPKVEAAEPDRAYFEPRIIFALGEGTLRSDIIRHGFDEKVEPLGLGIGLAGLVPIGERSSFVISGEYMWTKTNWRGGFEKENLRRFRISAGIRFYIEEE